MPKPFLQIIDPGLLHEPSLSQRMSIFLCGPGTKFQSDGSDVRLAVRKALEDMKFKVWMGEDLETENPLSSRRADLQTHETRLAHNVDFTVLLLNSPGAYSELGTFSMIPNIAHRLYAVVPSQYYRAESYIARGPLSLLTQYSQNNVIYHDFGSDILFPLRIPITFYQFCRYQHGVHYQKNAITKFKNSKFGANDYPEYMKTLRV